MKKVFKEIFLFFCFLITTSAIILFKNINSLDELWNYNFANCISKGLIPYKDFNMIVTPLLSFINGFALYIFGNQLIIIRILAVILSSCILLVIYKIFKYLKINENIANISIILIEILLISIFANDYNFFVIFLFLIITLLELKTLNREYNVIYNLVIGIILGLCFLTKQTIGILYIILFFINRLIYMSINKKLELKNILFNFINVFIGIVIPVSIFFIFLFSTNSLKDFYEYCFLGIKNFKNYVSYSSLFINGNYYAILVPISWLFILKYIINNKDKILLTLFLFAIVNMAFVIPIADGIHFMIAIIPTLICWVYYLNKNILYDKIKNKEKVNRLCNLALVLVFIFGSIGNIVGYCIKNNCYTDIKHFKYLPMLAYINNSIKNVDEYIKNSKEDVYILDARAVIYMIPLDRYNKDFDMFLKGNIGVKDYIQYLNSFNNTKFLIMHDEERLNWQTPEEIIDYIRNNYKYIESIDGFDVYQK